MTIRTAQDNSPANGTVAILDDRGRVILSDLVPISVGVSRGSNKFTHPLETNASRADGKIITPVQIEYSGIIQAQDYQSTYNEIERIFIDSTTLRVRTRSRTFQNMIITSMPHEESADIFDALSIILILEETQIARTITPATNPDFTTTQRGQIQPSAASNDQVRQGSAAFRFFGFGG